MNEMITTNGFSAVLVFVNSTALELRDSALRVARGVHFVTTGLEQDLAVEAQRKLRGITKAMEATRQEVKKPALLIGKDIDAKALEYLIPCESEIARIGILLSEYQGNERARMQAEERARQSELARLETERLKAEAALVAAVKEQSKSEPMKAGQILEFDCDASIQSLQLDSMVASARLAKAESKPVAAVPRAAGMAVVDVWRWEVIDLRALLAFNEDLVTIEPSFRNIQRKISGGLHKIPGLRIWSETKVSVRTQSPSASQQIPVKT